MRIGISLSSSRPGNDQAAGARSIIARAKAANEAALDSVTLGDRHAMPTPYYQNVPMLGRVMADVAADRSVGCLFLLPLWHPVLVAEQVATLATMSDARFIIQTGIGAGRQQFDAVGASLETRGIALEESIRVIKALLAGETVSSDPFGILDASISPLPPVGVEWWLGAGVDKALERAATMGDAWYTVPSLTPSDLERPMRTYEAYCEASGTTPRTVLRKDVLVLADGDRARSVGGQLLGRGYRGMQTENVVIGGVDDAVEQLQAFADMGVADVIIRCMADDDRDALETIESFGQIRRRFASVKTSGIEPMTEV